MGHRQSLLALPSPPFTLLCVQRHWPPWSLLGGLLCLLISGCFGQWPSLARDCGAKTEKCWYICSRLLPWRALDWWWLQSLHQEPQLLLPALSSSSKILPCSSNCCISFLLQTLAGRACSPLDKTVRTFHHNLLVSLNSPQIFFHFSSMALLKGQEGWVTQREPYQKRYSEGNQPDTHKTQFRTS